MSDKDMIMISVFVFLPNIHATTKRNTCSDIYINIFFIDLSEKGLQRNNIHFCNPFFICIFKAINVRPCAF